jgi:multidrug efflux pump subunit AcrA (membrane-fusion protein)
MLLSSVSLVFVGCKDTASQMKALATAAASVTRVARENLAGTLTVAGQFQRYQEVDLHAKVLGYVRHINVDIDDRVRIDPVIATLDLRIKRPDSRCPGRGVRPRSLKTPDNPVSDALQNGAKWILIS